MHMHFWWDYKIHNYLFKGASINSIGSLIGVCICVAVMSFGFEFMRYLQAKKRQAELILRSEQLKTICPTESSTLLTERVTSPTTPNRPRINITLMDKSVLFGTELTLWFALQNLGYILMLSVMLYNGWLLISAVVGGGVGYFIFGQMFMKINLQNCQIIRDTWCMQKCGEPEHLSSTRDGESTPALEIASTSRSAFDCHQVVTANVHADCH